MHSLLTPVQTSNLRKSSRFCSLALDSAHVKFEGPYKRDLMLVLLVVIQNFFLPRQVPTALSYSAIKSSRKRPARVTTKFCKSSSWYCER